MKEFDRQDAAHRPVRRRLAAAMALALLAQCVLPYVHRWLTAAAAAGQRKADAAFAATSGAPLRIERTADGHRTHSEANCAVCQALAQKVGPTSATTVALRAALAAAAPPATPDATPCSAVVVPHAPRAPPFPV